MRSSNTEAFLRRHLVPFILAFPLFLLAEYPYNPLIPKEIWEELTPYFLPEEHPIKDSLDQIFHQSRVTANEETFTKAGFAITRSNRPYNAVVTGHKKLKGFLVKVYLDSQYPVIDWQMWMRRIKGCEVIKKCIAKHRLTQLLVPKKWIYPLPQEPSLPEQEGTNRKHFILVVEDMRIVDHQENSRMFKEKMTGKLLKEIFTAMAECELTDCVWIGNMPFTKKGRIAFIDTELFYNGFPEFERLKKYLSTPMQEHLDQLIQRRLSGTAPSLSLLFNSK